jgi:hypothetical protein
VALKSLTSFWASGLETVRAQNWTVPVALTPKVDEPAEPAEEGLDPDDEHAAAADSSMTAAAPVSACLAESFIAVACSRCLSGLGNQGRTHWRRKGNPFPKKLRSLGPRVNPLAGTDC